MGIGYSMLSDRASDEHRACRRRLASHARRCAEERPPAASPLSPPSEAR